MAKLPNRRTAAVQALDHAVSPIYLLDASQRIVYCNPSCLQWLAVSQEQLLGQCVDYCAHPVGELAVWGGLAAPPLALDGRLSNGVVWISPDQVTMRPYHARFLGLPASADTLGDVLVVVGGPVESDTPPLGYPPSKDSSDLHERLLHFSANITSSLRIDALVGDSPAIKRARAQVQVAAEHIDRVLIVGPRGSGHEAVARAIHEGRRRGKHTRLFPLDCDLLDADLLQATLSAFIRRAAELAESGDATVLLLDIHQLAPAAQGRLLEMMNDKSYSLRTLATAIPDLPAGGEFDPMLAAALGTLTIRLPAVTERLEDLSLLIQSVVERTNRDGTRQLAGVTPEAFDQLVNYPWHGNLDELVGLLGEARDVCQSNMIDVRDLPARISLSAEAERFASLPPQKIQLDEYLAGIERELIERALGVAKGNRASGLATTGDPSNATLAATGYAGDRGGRRRRMIPAARPSATVFERDGEWSRALRRFIRPEIYVSESPMPSVSQLPESSWPCASLWVVSATEEVELAMAWAQQLQRERPHYLRMAVVRPADQELAWCLRETGVSMVWDEFWQVPRMARLVERFWQRMPPPDLSVEQRIWNNLPWRPMDP